MFGNLFHKFHMKFNFKIFFINNNYLMFDQNHPNFGNVETITHPINLSQNTIQLSLTPEKKVRKKYSKKNILQQEGRNIGHWSQNQKIQYYMFLEKHQNHFLKSQLRRTDKIFKEMSRVLGTRAADQCRSHHQKMEKKYGNFLEILISLRELYAFRSNDQLFKIQEQVATDVSPQVQDFQVGIDFKQLNFDDQNIPIFYQEIKTTKDSKEQLIQAVEKYTTTQNTTTEFTKNDNLNDLDIVDMYLNY